MKAKPLGNIGIVSGNDVSITVNLTPGQVWEASENKYIPGRMIVKRHNVIFNMSKEAYLKYFREVK